MGFRLVITFMMMPVFLLAQYNLDTTRRVNFLAIPILFRTPETGWAFGASGNCNFKTTFRNDSLTRISTVTLLAIFSQREQNIQGLDATIYFPKEKYILYFQSAHSYFPDKFWGIGSKTLDINEEKYTFESLSVNPHFKKKFSKHLFFGAISDYQNVLKVRYSSNQIFDTAAFFGKSPYQILGLGLTASYDTRNSTFWPTRGIFTQSHFVSYNKGMLSDFSFHKWMTELRVFVPLFKGHVLAGQLYNLSTFGDTPFKSMASFGGQGNMRGFYQGRFRDKSMYSAILEYRAHLFWQVSACVFGGVGDVYNNFNKINSSTIKYSFGGGLRLSILPTEKYNLRFDYGYSDKYNQAFYFTVGECF